VIIYSRPGKALVLALLCVAIADCGNNPAANPKRVEASALQAEIRDPQARAFYEARRWQAAWDRKSEQALVAIIHNAANNGLKPDLFLKGPLPADANAREAALTRAALSYASALARGYADPRKISATYTLPRPAPKVAQGLAQAIEQKDLEKWFGSLPPQTDEYRALSQAHLQFLQLAGQANASPVPDGKAIKPGRRDGRIPAVTAALRASGYVPPAPPGEHAAGTRFSRPLVAAVKALQADYGMRPDGVIGPATITALNSGAAGRARQLAIAMERLRWLERDPPATRIDVNTAATMLDYWRGGQLVDRRAVVTGEPDKQTPQIQSSFEQIVANPKWRVPDSIAAKELATKGSGWLAANNFAFENGRYVQQSGPKNSLGLVKFDMQDKQQIYLHDTPAKALFGLPERHRSHGCVRVQNALQFAAMLANQDGVLPQLQKALSSGDESYVKLKTSIPVRLFYHTAFWDGSRIQFRPDVYGWDDDVAMALGLVRGGPRRPIQGPAEDIGP
jgi:murein L,D-transpeptidase YcbB/YkuD